MLGWCIPAIECDGFSLSQDDPLVYEKQVAYVSQFYKAADDLEFEITEEFIDHWVNTFAAMSQEGVGVPMPKGHTTDPEMKRASVLSLEKKIDSKGRIGLFEKLKFNDADAAAALSNSDVSIYVEKSMTSGTGKFYQYPITHIAFTDYPVIPGMDKFVAVAASLKATPVFPKDVFKKDKDMTLSQLAKALSISVEENDNDDTLSQKISDCFVALSNENKALKEKIEKPKEEKPKLSPAIVSMGLENRKLKLQGLLDEGYMSPAEYDSAEKHYCSEDAVTLALSSDSHVDNFEWYVETIKKRTPNKVHRDSSTGPQVDEELVLSLSNDKENGFSLAGLMEKCNK